ncbi:hypothetical protein DL96DRAFT_92634 [Flagelloscypha sp. PMI_526]|nr:hypothetical protein DL96DRAFT_92634 [Flagelloscypha sp. PMI_526]
MIDSNAKGAAWCKPLYPKLCSLCPRRSTFTMPKVENGSRPSLATSSSAFALPTPTSSTHSNSSTDHAHDLSVAHRLRRSSVVQPTALHVNSPLASSFIASGALSSPRRSYHRPSMSSDEAETMDDSVYRRRFRSRPPSTPPPRRSSFDESRPRSASRRPSVSLPLKQPRVRSLLAETRPEEIEVRSEAAFQRLVSSNVLSSNALGLQPPRTPRSAVDRGRFPEEARTDDFQPEDPGSDDEDDLQAPFAYRIPSTESLAGLRSAAQSVAGDDPPSINGTDSNSSTPMDVDMPYGSPSMPSSMTQWRYTPPPTSTSAVRSNKRKLDDRFEPYPSAKRRAVSPSLVHLRNEALGVTSTPSASRPSRIAIPVPTPGSALSSATSSPTISSSYSTAGLSRSLNMSCSPTMRSSSLILSPIIHARPIPRPRTLDDERAVDGADDAVNGLTLA